MKVKFWGTRGSLPGSFSQKIYHERLKRVLALADKKDFSTEQAIEGFLESLPPELSTTCGTNTCCVEVDCDLNEYILCDAGTGIRDFAVDYMKRGLFKKPAVFHIFMTHLHWDHIQGFPFFTPIYIPGNKVIVHGYHHEMANMFQNQMKPPCFPVFLEKLDAEVIFDIQPPCTPFQIGDLAISSLQQYHPGISYGYRFEHKGKSFVYSTDSEHTENSHYGSDPFIDFFDHADLLVFDAMYSLADANINKVSWGHSSNIMALKLAALAKVNHLLLFHHEPTRSDQELFEFLRDTEVYRQIYHRDKGLDDYPRKISLAYDGLVVNL
ncbi:MAG: hypothetical protein A2Y14_04860 [Verrucomicrobia bacterium GWF2_51_19]|nr:MAG: hypothetical protein A2Y14_04860 [Verrucomicrobia bacterium GWF2_51_19]HCJ11550.1 hypothetical protein [Opitutae bacterium]